MLLPLAPVSLIVQLFDAFLAFSLLFGSFLLYVQEGSAASIQVDMQIEAAARLKSTVSDLPALEIFLYIDMPFFSKSATEQHGSNSRRVFLQRYTETGFKISSKTTSQFSDHFHTFSLFFTLFHCFDVDSQKLHSFSLYFTIFHYFSLFFTLFH